MENKSPLRTLYIVQLLTIVVLVLLLIQQILPFFGIRPIGKPLPQLPPGKMIQPGAYVSPSNRPIPELGSEALVQALNAQMIVQHHGKNLKEMEAHHA